MKLNIVFISGFLNNHILPICEELNLRSQFTFIATHRHIDTDKANRDSIEKNYVLHAYIEAELEKCIDITKKADIAICGGSSNFFLKIRKKYNKLTYIYSERLFKRGTLFRFYPPTKKIINDIFLSNNNSVYVLCASSYLSQDLKLINFLDNRCFKFGYFPTINDIDLQSLLKLKMISNTNDKLRLLYVGRMLKWKRIDLILKMCHLLDIIGINYEMNIIGEGKEKKSLEKLAQKYNLRNCIFRGALPNEIVHSFMQRSHLLYLSSNYYEGWGTVVNEGMGNGCVPIVTQSCGCARYLIKDGENGYITKCRSYKSLFQATLKYYQSNNKTQLHINAYRTIQNLWNAKIATQRLLTLSENLINKTVFSNHAEGPLSIDN